MRSNFYINKAEYYFQLFLEIFKLEAMYYYIGMDTFTYQLKLKDLDLKLMNIEDIEDGLYLIALDLDINFPNQIEIQGGKLSL